MSRRSLRLHMPPGERGSPYGSASFSVGVPARREPASSKASRQPHLSVSCSQSLLQTPCRPSLHHLNSSIHSVASDASLISSMLDESSIQEKTLVDSFWGLDDDGEPQGDTVFCEHSAALANSTLVCGRDERRLSQQAQTQTSMVTGYHCRDYPLPPDRTQAPGALQSSSAYPHPTARAPVGQAAAGVYSGAQTQGPPAGKDATSPISTIYCREKSRKCKPGVCVSVWEAVRGACRRTAASLALLLALMYRHLLLRKHLDPEASSRSGGGMDSAGPGAQNGSVGDPKNTSAKEPTVVPPSSPSPTSPSASSPPSPSSSSSSFASSVLYLLLGLLWIASSSAGAYVWQLAQRAGSAGWVVTQKRVSELRASSPPAGQVGSSVLRWLQRGWCQAVSGMSLLKNFLLDWCLPNLFRIVLLLLLLLLLSALLGWWDPRQALASVLPADGADWQDALPLSSVPGLAAMLRPPQKSSSDHQSAPSPPEQSTDIQTYAQTPPPPSAMQEEEEAAAEEEVEGEDGEGDEASPGDSERLQQLELSLSRLWERVEESGLRAEQRHGEVLGLYHGLRQQLLLQAGAGPGADRADLEPWVDGLLEIKLAEMTVRLEEDRLHREQTRKQYTAQQKSQAFRLAELEQLLQALTAKMEQVQQRQETVATTTTTLWPTSTSRQPTSVSGVDSESHDALRSDVSRLEVALGSVRQDLKGLSGCQNHCERLDAIQGTLFSQVRAQVREELRSALYGNQLVSLSPGGDDDGDLDNDQTALPDSLLQWLSERFVSAADLRASLAALELGILGNVSQQLEKLELHRGEPDRDNDGDDNDNDNDDHRKERQTVVTQAVVDSLKAAGTGVTEEEVQLMVQNALRLYSQDRTGLADYALESGGGSILSTRCSETYGTRTALLSLFGLPLWYFSQSPRVVIQPDVQPGNCWAFKGSTGYLVIRLSMRVRPTAFSLEHIPKALAPSGALRSAPRDFAVHGLDDESQEEGTLLGTYSYEEDGEALQTFDVTEENEQAFQIIEVRVLSNWGNPEYTCMYRLRVHGAPSDD